MSEMTAREFIRNVVQDKQFRQEVMDNCYDYKPENDERNDFGLWLNEGAAKMGYEFDAGELNDEFEEQVKPLNGFKKIALMGSLINMARKAKKKFGYA